MDSKNIDFTHNSVPFLEAFGISEEEAEEVKEYIEKRREKDEYVSKTLESLLDEDLTDAQKFFGILMFDPSEALDPSMAVLNKVEGAAGALSQVEDPDKALALAKASIQSLLNDLPNEVALGVLERIKYSIASGEMEAVKEKIEEKVSSSNQEKMVF